MKTSNWLFRWWVTMKLKEQINSPFKLKNEVDSLKSNSVLEIEQTTEPLWLNIKKLIYKIGIKTVQNNRVRIHRNAFKQLEILPNPVFTQNQIVGIVGKYWLFIIVIIGFIVSESFLYYLTASLFVPGGSQFMKIAVSIFLAMLIMFSLDFCFGKHFQYREAAGHHSKKEINDIELKKYRDRRNLGYALIVLSFAAIIFSGLARIFFLENIPGTGLTPEKLKSVQRASKMASLLTMVVTIIAAILLALLKQEQSKIAIKYHVYRNWHNALIKRNDYTQVLIRDANKMILITEQSIEKHWQLVIDLKRIFKMPQEYDEKYEELNQEYLGIKSKPGFTLNDHLYRKFLPIQAAHEELFRYGILNSAEIKDKITLANTVLKTPENYINEQLDAINHQTQSVTSTPSALTLNGNPKDKKFSTI